ncbi:MAG: PP2C family protein-serine/threonine phosphatase [Candidatus Krumholzibacteriota bacterium]
MHKHLYRTVESLMDRIDHSAGDEKMLLDILQLLVESDDMADFGVVSGRLYLERERDYLLIESISGHGPRITGKTVSKDYQVVKDIQRRRLWIVSPESPGWDPDLEAQFSDVDSAAILIGRDPSYILSLGIRHHGSEDDLLVLLETIRASVGLKLREQAYVNQMKQAQAIQHSLLPARMPSLDGYEIAAVSHPAAEVGGDVFDVQRVEEGVLGLMLADASGHGLPAALQARDVVIGMRMGQAENEKITATISRLNRVIHHSGLTSRFISLFYGELEETGSLTYVNGGHCPPLLLNSEGEVFELKVCGPVLGPLPDAVYRRAYITMKPGETLIMFTDGVTERVDPAGGSGEDDIVEFGRQGLIDTVRGCGNCSAEDLVAEIVRRVREFGQGQPFEDDVSVMVVKRLAADNYPPMEDLTLVSPATRR